MSWEKTMMLHQQCCAVWPNINAGHITSDISWSAETITGTNNQFFFVFFFWVLDLVLGLKNSSKDISTTTWTSLEL